MPVSNRISVLFYAVWTVIGIIVLIGVGIHLEQQHHQNQSTAFATPFQAILLANGSVYFGHLHGFGSAHPILEDVFYIVSQTDPQTKQVNNMLVKRGKELHEPDRMYLNPSQIVFVEPVGPKSKVAELIAKNQ